MAKLSRPGTRSYRAAQPQSSPQESSSDESIPSTAVVKRTGRPTASLREKRKPDINPAQPPPKRIRRLNAFARARASSDAEEGVGDDAVVNVNPAVLDVLNNGPFSNSSRPPKPARNRITVELPQFRKRAEGPPSRGRQVPADQGALDTIEESPRPRQADIPFTSVEREEPDEELDVEPAEPQAAENDHAEHEDLDNQEADDINMPRDFVEEAVREPTERPRSRRTINGLSNRVAPLRVRGALNVEDEDFGYGHSAPTGAARSGRVTLSPEATEATDAPSVQSIFTAEVNTRRLRAMVRLMGRPGWTGNGKHWERGFSQDEPGVTPVGKRLFKYLLSFRTLIRGAPKLDGTRNLGKQKAWFDANHNSIQKHLSESAKLVAKIRDDELSLPDADGLGPGDRERRRAVVADLMSPIIPQLVRLLGSLFSLGGIDPESPGEILEEVRITPDILRYIQAVTKWISSLRTKLRWELEERPLKNQHVRGAELEKLIKEQSSAWRLFDGALLEFKQDLDDAEEQHDEAKAKENEEDRLAECRQRDEEIREAREREEEEEAALKDRQYEAVARSTQWIKSQPRPLQAKWNKANERYSLAPFVRPSRSKEPFQPLMSGGRAPPPPPPDLPEWVLQNKIWILDQISKKDAQGRTSQPTRELIEAMAETLGLELNEVREEVTAFQRSARDLASQQGVAVPEWARDY